MISVFSSVLANWCGFRDGDHPKLPFSGRQLPILAVLGSLILAVLLAPNAHAQDAKPFLLTIDQGSVNRIIDVAFYCEPDEQAEEQGFKDCGQQTVPGYEAAPDWWLGMDLSITCPIDEVIFVFSSGPVKILWPNNLTFVLTTAEGCSVQPWLYYHADRDGGFVGLKLDPKTQRLSIQQSEVPYQ